MGYNTNFKGKFYIEPPLPDALINTVNAFCEIRHENSTDVGIGIWCDWVVSNDGSAISWNGNEKSYDMFEWIGYLHKKFFPGHALIGAVHARGDDPDDRWVMVGHGLEPASRHEMLKVQYEGIEIDEFDEDKDDDE